MNIKTSVGWLILVSGAIIAIPAAMVAQRPDVEIAAGVIQRLDSNRDGKLDSTEIPLRARPGIERLARETGQSLDKPISIEKLQQHMLRMQQQQDQEQGDERRDGRRDRRDDGRERDDRRDRDDRRWSETPRSSPDQSNGFGAGGQGSSVQGFGAGTRTLSGKVEDNYDERVIREADRTLRRYDRNQNGQLEQEEWERGRWSNDPRESDLNKDGILSRAELCERVKLRWESERERRASRSRDSGRSSNNFRSASAGSSGESSSSDAEKVKRYAEGLIKRYDENKNGVLEKNEWSRMRGNPKESDVNNDDRLTLDEMVARLQGYSRGTVSTTSSSNEETRSRSSRVSRDRGERGERTGREDRFGRRDRRDRTTPWSRGRDRSDERRDRSEVAKRSYRFPTPAERLERTLPRSLRDGFLEMDKNGDGQIAMVEFSSSWSLEKADEFNKIDLNNDGIITPKEYVTTKENE